MLFLYALLFFVLGSSVVANPVTTPYLSRRGNVNSKSPVDVSERINGFWFTHLKKKILNIDLCIYMKIENGAVVEIRPQPNDNIEVETVTDYVVWSRTIHSPLNWLKGLEHPSQMIDSNRHRFPRDQLFTASSISTIKMKGTISVELRPDEFKNSKISSNCNKYVDDKAMKTPVVSASMTAEEGEPHSALVAVERETEASLFD
ncbi:hypothetical protein F5887DRAFT_1159188 [Amanita rubescens]|nr:hypothetical protein F5887DRAFT_1159188 [Amanita rubescens]